MSKGYACFTRIKFHSSLVQDCTLIRGRYNSGHKSWGLLVNCVTLFVKFITCGKRSVNGVLTVYEASNSGYITPGTYSKRRSVFTIPGLNTNSYMNFKRKGMAEDYRGLASVDLIKISFSLMRS